MHLNMLVLLNNIVKIIRVLIEAYKTGYFSKLLKIMALDVIIIPKIRWLDYYIYIFLFIDYNFFL